MKFTNTLPLFCFWIANSIDEELLTSIINLALTKRNEAPIVLSTSLNKYIETQVKTGSYRIGFAQNAPVNELIPVIVNHIKVYPRVALYVLQVWAWARSDLQQSILKDLKEETIALWDTSKPMERLQGVWLDSVLKQSCATVLPEDKSAAEVMACLLTGCIPLPDESKYFDTPFAIAASQTPEDMEKSWLNMLERVRAEDPLWTNLDSMLADFLTSARSIAIQKKEMVEKACRETLAEAVKRMLGDTDSIAYFGLKPEEYRVENCSPEICEGLASDIDRLLGLIQRHKKLRSAVASARSVAEEDALFEQTQLLRVQIINDSKRLNKFLQPGDEEQNIGLINKLPNENTEPFEPTIQPLADDYHNEEQPESQKIDVRLRWDGENSHLGAPSNASQVEVNAVQPVIDSQVDGTSHRESIDTTTPEVLVAGQLYVGTTQVDKEDAETKIKKILDEIDPSALVMDSVQNVLAGLNEAPIQEEQIILGEQPSQEEPGIEEENIEESNESTDEVIGQSEMPELAQIEEKKPLVALSPEEAVVRQQVEAAERIKVGDIPAVFWMSRALEQMGISGCLPSGVACAVQGALWYASFWPNQPSGWLASIRELIQPGSFLLNREWSCEMAAAGVLLSLFDPTQGWSEWINGDVIGLPAASQVLVAVREFSRYSILLDPKTLNVGKELENLEETICQKAEEVKEWLRTANKRSARIPAATSAWSKLVSSQGALYTSLLPVACDDRKSVDEVIKTLEEWKGKGHTQLDRLIQQASRVTAREKGRFPTVIDGEARNQLIFWSLDVARIAEEWADAVKLLNRKPEHSWQEERITDFHQNMIKLLTVAREELESEILSGQVAPGVLLLNRSFCILQAVLFSSQEGQALLLSNRPLPDQPNGFYSASRNLLLANLYQRLMVYPELPWHDDITLSKEDETACLPFLIVDPMRSLEAALNRCVELHDFRLANLLLLRPSISLEFVEKIRNQYFQNCRMVEAELDRTVTANEQSWIEGLIGESIHTDYKDTIESIRNQLRQSKEQKEFKIMANLSDYERRLRKIQQECADYRKERLKRSRTHWETIKNHLSEIIFQNEELEFTVNRVIERSIEEGNIRVVEQYLSHLDDARANPPLNGKLFAPRETQDPLVKFQKKTPGLGDLLQKMRLPSVIESLRSDRPFAELGVANLTRSQREETASALNAWLILNNWNENQRQSIELFPYLTSVMKYLGFEPVSDAPVSIVGGETNGNSNAFQSWNVVARPETQAPVRQFGTERYEKYQVVGVWERKGFDLISAVIEKQIGKNQPAIVLYFARLSLSQRERLLTLSRQNDLPVIVVDEILAFYLAREPEFRLPALFSCALPYATLNPYLEITTGVVPSELFKGREEELKRLRDPNGPTIIYGGRQLGKSALLHRREEEFQKTEGGYAIFEDIRTIGDPTTNQDYKRAIRDRLWNALFNLGLLEKKYSTAPFEKIIEVLMNRLKSDSKISVLLLLDEADNFLDADATTDFYVVSHLKRVRDSSQGRFRLILAGLHNVLRFQQSNQPLAHLGSVLVGPLDAQAALDLLEQPLRAIGYHFGDDPTVPLHILSYTNFHPGLIQVFAHRLVEYMSKKRLAHHHPPFIITRSDVEAVYRDRKVREDIKNRFVWTLQLDRRYEAIAYSMIFDQWEEQNGFDHLYTQSELYIHARDNWPQAFDEVLSDEFAGYLEEMRGLGVLSEYEQDGKRYRLSSPNLVHLLGSREDILNALGDLTKRTPPSKRNLQSLHYQLSHGKYSPLTFDQEQRLNGSKSGVSLVFGSAVSGVLLLTEALSTLTKNNNGKYNEIRSDAKTKGMARYLYDFVKSNQTTPFRLAYCELEGETVQDLVNQVEVAAIVCQKIEHGVLRVVFSLSPQAAWLWHQLSFKEREYIEQEKVDSIILLRRYDAIGIRQRLEHYSGRMIPTEKQIDETLAATGGWSLLVDYLLTEIKSSDDNPLPAVERMREIFLAPGSKLREEFWRQFGVFDAVPLKMLSALKMESQVKEAFVSLPENEALDYLLSGIGVANVEWKNVLEYLTRMASFAYGPLPIIEPVLAQVLYDHEPH